MWLTPTPEERCRNESRKPTALYFNTFLGYYPSMSVQIEGFEELADQFDELSTSLDVEQDIPMEELFTDGFMATNTDFDSISEFFEESRWTVESEEDFEKIDEAEFDRYVDKHTGFSSWEAMLSAAAREWLTRQIDL